MSDTRRLMVSLGFAGNSEATDAEGLPERHQRPGPDESLLAQRLAGIAGIVEDQVVPRLIEAYDVDAEIPDEQDTAIAEPDAEIIEHLAELAVNDGPAAKDYVRGLHAEGLSIEAIYLGVLAPTARLLGQYWETDQKHFAEVTIGVGVLQQMLRDFEVTFQADAKAWQPALRVLLMPAPGEQHTFGLFMIGEFMRRAGWDTWTGPLPSTRELTRLVGSGDFPVVGFSASSDSRLDDLTSTIALVRRLSKGNPLCVMVGGCIFAERPSLVNDVGADGTASNAQEAIKLAHQMISGHIAPS